MPRLNTISVLCQLIEKHTESIDMIVNTLKQYINLTGNELSSDNRRRVGDTVNLLTATENLLGYQAKEINNILRLIAPRIAHEKEIDELANQMLPIETPEEYSGLQEKQTPDDALSKLKLT